MSAEGEKPVHQPPASRRHVAFEAAAVPVGAAGCLWLSQLEPRGGLGGPVLWLVLAVVYCLAARVQFRVAHGWAIPSQIVFVPILALLPPALVPVTVGVAVLAGTVPGVVRGQEPPDRLLIGLNDGLPPLAAVLALVAAGAPAARLPAAPVYMLAFAVQALVDFGQSALRVRAIKGRTVREHARAYAHVFVTDALMVPGGFAIAVVATGHPWAALLSVPLVSLLALLARDREQRIALAEGRLEELARERRRHQRAVVAFGETMATGLDSERLLGQLLRATAEALDAGAALVGAPAGEPLAALGEPVAALAAAAALTGDGPARACVDGWSALACPIADGMVLAVARRGREFSPDDEFLLGHLCVQAALSLENARLHDHLAHQAVTDGLTGLPNHRRFQELLGAERARAAREGEPLAVVLVDVDDFKSLNDGLGHQAGDQVLAAVAGALRDACRAHETPARYGGEEFAVVVFGGDSAAAGAVGERLRAAVEACAPLGRRVTVSVGAASAPAGAIDPRALVGEADRALYEAKRQGKNRCVVASGAWTTTSGSTTSTAR